MERPRLAMISTMIRRDLQDPIKYFSKIKVMHFYRIASGDITPDDLKNTVQFSTPWKLYSKLKSERPRLLQGTEPFGILPIPYLIAGWIYVRRHHIPLVVISPENRPLHVKYGRVIASFLRRFLKKYLQDASLIIYLNEGARENFRYCEAPEGKTVRLMYGTWGVDTQEFSPIGPVQSIVGDRRTILFVGRIIRAKGVFDLVKALSQIVPVAPDVHLVLVGDGSDRRALEKQIKQMGLEDRVHFTGMVDNRELPAYFRAASVFACPSITVRGWAEQIGMANIQAMACGVPVVSTSSGAIPEYVIDGATGLLVPESDPHMLAEAILRILSDTDFAAELATNGREYALRKYDAAMNIPKVEQHLVALCSDNPVLK